MNGKRKVRDTHGRRYTLGKSLGSGGQAEVFAIEGKKELAAKIYRNAPGPIERAKLEWMIAHPPAPAGLPGVLIAWPQDLLLDDRGRLIGYQAAVRRERRRNQACLGVIYFHHLQ